MDKVSFKERVRQIIIQCSKKYKENFLDYNYLVCSSAFTENDYYIINAHADNYQHLTGVNSVLSPKTFFEKCFNGTITTDEFDFIKKG